MLNLFVAVIVDNVEHKEKPQMNPHCFLEVWALFDDNNDWTIDYRNVQPLLLKECFFF